MQKPISVSLRISATSHWVRAVAPPRTAAARSCTISAPRGQLYLHASCQNEAHHHNCLWTDLASRDVKSDKPSTSVLQSHSTTSVNKSQETTSHDRLLVCLRWQRPPPSRSRQRYRQAPAVYATLPVPHLRSLVGLSCRAQRTLEHPPAGESGASPRCSIHRGSPRCQSSSLREDSHPISRNDPIHHRQSLIVVEITNKSGFWHSRES